MHDAVFPAPLGEGRSELGADSSNRAFFFPFDGEDVPDDDLEPSLDAFVELPLEVGGVWALSSSEFGR